MDPIDQEKEAKAADTGREGSGRQAASCPEVCSEFLTVLAKATKNTALYTLSHPVVLESLRKASDLLNSIFTGNRLDSFTLSFMDDNWYFNEIPVPALTRESQNLNVFFHSHGLRGLKFVNGVRPFELGALCEFLGSPAKNRPEGYAAGFFAQKEVANIRPETVRFVKERGYDAEVPYAPVPGPGFGAAPAGESRVRFAPTPRPPAPDKSAAPEYTPEKARPPVPQRFGPPRESVLSSMNFGGLLTRLVESAVKDPAGRAQVYEDALRMIRENMEAQVARTTSALAEEKERAVNTRTRTEKVLSRVADGKVIIDKDGKVLMMNQAAEEISGKRLVDVAGRHISEHLNPGEHFLTISEDMDLSGGKPVSGAVRLEGDERVGRALRRSVALLEDPEGRVVGAYTTLPDVVKYKEAQRMQEEFLSRVTHDLQSPLSSISSALEMLTDTTSSKLDPDEKNFLAISVRNSQRLSTMIREILDFSKLQSGKMTVHPEPVSVSAMLSEACEGLLPWARTKELMLEARPPRPDAFAMADHPRVVQVLTNLISNAIKSTPKGGSIVVAASRVVGQERSIVIGVRDTGAGIPKEDLKKLFNKFVQIENLGEPREGVGLGLAIVNEFVALHGGKVWAESEPGKGSTFYFTLPLAGRPA